MEAKEKKTLKGTLYGLMLTRRKDFDSESLLKEILDSGISGNEQITGKFSFNKISHQGIYLVDRQYLFESPLTLRGYKFLEKGTRYDEGNPSEEEIFQDMADNMRFYSKEHNFSCDNYGNFQISQSR